MADIDDLKLKLAAAEARAVAAEARAVAAEARVAALEKNRWLSCSSS